MTFTNGKFISVNPMVEPFWLEVKKGAVVKHLGQSVQIGDGLHPCRRLGIKRVACLCRQLFFYYGKTIPRF